MELAFWGSPLKAFILSKEVDVVASVGSSSRVEDGGVKSGQVIFISKQ